jgi:alcohol dehydrogenase (NADP+)
LHSRALSAEHDINAYINLVRRDGTIAMVDAPPVKPLPVTAFGLMVGRRNAAYPDLYGSKDD